MTIDAHSELPEDLGPWVIIANITKQERFGPDQDLKHFGTRVFSPGAKVYIGSMDGGAFDNFGVIGQNRVSKKLSGCMVNIRALENFRSKVIYKRAVLQKLLWSQFMPVWQKQRPNERNVGAGSICLFNNEEACEKIRQSMEDKREVLLK